jgi:2-dehydropantoate 2-reductase
MRLAILGSGAVGGYYGARLARAGHEVTFLARGAHLQAIRDRGLQVRSPLGDFVVRAPATDDPAEVGPVDAVIFAVKTYDNSSALPLLKPFAGNGTTILTLQNGVDSVDEVAAVVGTDAVLGGATYVATALSAPGLIEQTGTHRRVVFGEVFGRHDAVSPRVERLAAAMLEADIQAEPKPDARVPLWEKFIYLAPFAGFTGAARLPIGPLWSRPAFPALFLEAAGEVERVACAESVVVSRTWREEITKYIDAIPPTTRSSLLIDLQQGKRIEVEALPGSVSRRGARAGVPTPIMTTLYAVLKPHEQGSVPPSA